MILTGEVLSEIRTRNTSNTSQELHLVQNLLAEGVFQISIRHRAISPSFRWLSSVRSVNIQYRIVSARDSLPAASLFIAHKRVPPGGESIDGHECSVSSVIDDVLFGKVPVLSS